MRTVDVIVVGGGFAGSIMAMILRKLGRTVAILEKARHPRFAIGESSTPLANLLLEEIALKYGLPDLGAFSKWGSWQEAHPEIACGLKRGFTFYRHEWGRPVDFTDRTRQLLVAASPRDRIADTHWYRPQFDAHLARSAGQSGAELHEAAQFQLEERGGCWRATGVSDRGEFSCGAPFLIDATGPRGCLHQHFGFIEKTVAPGFPGTQAVFAHFKDVELLGHPDHPDLPYPPDAAAVHHIFDGGWIWVLRFNNGLVSAGAAAIDSIAGQFGFADGEDGWRRLIAKLPTVHAQFRGARPATPFFHQRQVPFRSSAGAGQNWAMLPSAIGFVDPLFSTGFVLTLLGVARLADLFSTNNVDAPSLGEYERKSFQELDATGALVRDAYESFGCFGSFCQLARAYFVAAIRAETLRRLGRPAPAFLLADDPNFSPAWKGGPVLSEYDLGGLMKAGRNNWHPALQSDLFEAAHKIPATHAEIEAMARRCGL